MTSSLRDLKVYTTYPHSCSYLQDQEATTLFVDPRQEVDQALYSNLSVLGFRRSGNHLSPNRTQRRALRRNDDLEVELTGDIRDQSAFDLYRRYIEARHADGDMYPPDREQYQSFLDNAWECTRYYRFYDGGRLIAIAVVDELLDGLSAIYTFFDPDLDVRSLGRYAILWQVQRAREQELDYLYLGYWIRGCRKMAYKSEYRPLEIYVNGRWSSLL